MARNGGVQGTERGRDSDVGAGVSPFTSHSRTDNMSSHICLGLVLVTGGLNYRTLDKMKLVTIFLQVLLGLEK